MMELIKIALAKNAAVYGSVSGGKDGQAAVRTMKQNGIPLTGLIHCDLGRSEWPQSMAMCEKQAAEYGLPLHILRRRDGLDLLAYMQRRMRLLAGTGKPFWPSSAARYCTSDLKRGPSDAFFRHCGHNLIISAEGIRAQESTARAKKEPLSVRKGVTSDYYTYIDGMNAKGKPIRKYFPVAECLLMYRPDRRLVLNWYPIFNMTLAEVWDSYGIDTEMLATARSIYAVGRFVPEWWPFHPAYAMGNDRVSCMLCILGSPGDLRNGARQNPSLLQEMIGMETESGCTFKEKFSLTELLTA